MTEIASRRVDGFRKPTASDSKRHLTRTPCATGSNRRLEPITRESEFTDLGAKHRGLIIESYTSLQAAEPDDFKTSVDAIDARADNLDLPGGRHVGIFLHEAIEKLDFKSFGDAPDLKSWMARDDVRELFASIDAPPWR